MSALQATVRNTSSGVLRFSFLPPHGVTLQPNETYSWFGTITDVGTSAGPEVSSRARAFRAFQFCLDNSLLAIIEAGSQLSGQEVALGNFPVGGVIGTASATVDIAAGISIAQTTAGQTLTLPPPSDTAASRIVIVSNTGSAAVTLHGSSLPPGQSSIAIWNAVDESWRMIATGASTSSDGVFFTNEPPVGPGGLGQATFVLSGDYEGFLYVHDGAAWVYQTQYRVPVFTVEPEPTLQRVIDIAAAISGEFYVDYASGGSLFRYRIFDTGIVEGPMSGGSGSFVFPPDAVGSLRNDGSGNLSWQDANRQYTHTQVTPSSTWNVNHGLNAQVDSVNIYVGGQLVGADVEIVDLNNLTITFAAAEVGIAVVET